MDDKAIRNEEVNPTFDDDLGRIEQAVRLRLGYRVHELRLWVEPHGLVLTGHAHSYYDKQLAQQLVRDVGNLSVAENRIVVDLKSGGSCSELPLPSEDYRTHHRKLRRPDSAHDHHFAESHTFLYAR